ILFDLFETLISEYGQNPTPASSLGFDLGVDSAAFRAEWKVRRSNVLLGQISFSRALAEIATTLKHPAENSLLDRIRNARIREKAQSFSEIQPQVLALLRELRSRGIRMCVVSNCFAEDVTAWHTSSLASEFDATAFSFEVHLAKPGPEIYAEACRRLAVEQDATLFISDGMQELVGAEEAGIRAFQALWFLKRWPNFSRDSLYSRALENIDDILNLI
ncbi:HAD-IA family hydrolase, partial [bacterium]|nr:HAD-IA family hydrolase [bacterium]